MGVCILRRQYVMYLHSGNFPLSQQHALCYEEHETLAALQQHFSP